MELTAKLKQWLQEHCDVEEGSDDAVYESALIKALAEGTLSPDEWTELRTAPQDKEANVFGEKLDQIATGLTSLTTLLTQQAAKSAEKQEEPKEKQEEPKAKEVDLGKVIADNGGTDIRVKGAWERYNTTKSAVVHPERTKTNRPHPFAGQPAKDWAGSGKTLDAPSELDMAVIGAWAKHRLASDLRGGSRTFGTAALPEHDRELLRYAAENYKWCGCSSAASTLNGDRADIVDRELRPTEVKALFDDDGTSGGPEAVPVVFDEAVITTPLLYGELYPMVNVVPLDMGRIVDTVSINNVTGGWAAAGDATNISLFDTTSYVSEFSTTIFKWSGCIQIGLDFLSDTPVNFAQIITSQYGERLLEDLDDVIAVGNGSSEPEGCMEKGSPQSVNWEGATSLANYESMRFAIGKEEHSPAVKNTAVWCGTETSYQRARALAVSGTDLRRIMGYDYDSYTFMQRPYKINGALSHSQVFYAILARYRMYRRRGLNIRATTEGQTLIRLNEMLISAQARFGGQMERGACVCINLNGVA